MYQTQPVISLTISEADSAYPRLTQAEVAVLHATFPWLLSLTKKSKTDCFRLDDLQTYWWSTNPVILMDIKTKSSIKSIFGTITWNYVYWIDEISLAYLDIN